MTTSLGFTEHEEDDELGLVYMKGRTYDPRLGRFLQADPIVQAPTYSQSWNRYAYVMNNPLTLTDPSGFTWVQCHGCSGGWMWVEPGSGGSGGGDHIAPTPGGVLGWADNVTVTPNGTESAGSSASGGLPEHTPQDLVWAMARGGAAPEAGRDPSEGLGGPGSGRKRPANPNDIGYRLAVGVTNALEDRIDQLPKDFADAVMVIETVSGAASVVKLGATFLKTLGQGLAKNSGKAMAEVAATACPGGKCACFVAGTEVWTLEGLVPIEKLEAGQLVLSRDEATGELGWKRVVRTFVTPNKETLALSLRDDERGEHEQVEATAEHPFWAEGRGWVGAGELLPGQRVLRADGRWLRVERVEARAGRRTVHNLEVETYHTYMVGRLGAWVHNACGKEFVERALTAADIGLSPKAAEALSVVRGTVVEAGATKIVSVKYIEAAKLGSLPVSAVRKALPNVVNAARAGGVKTLQIEATFANGPLKDFIEKTVVSMGGKFSSSGGSETITFLF